jgi:hypothetical protein
MSKTHALGREPVQVWGLQPRKAAFGALLLLHDREGVVRLVVGDDEEDVRSGWLLCREGIG